MNTDNYHITDANTLVSLPAMIRKKSMNSLILPGSEAAPQTAPTPKTDGIRMSPMRLAAIQAQLRATAFPPVAEQSQNTLKTALSQLFMAVMAWFHSHDEPMEAQLVQALQRIREGGKGLFVSGDRFFADLRLLAMSPAAKDPEVASAIQAAEQALFQ